VHILERAIEFFNIKGIGKADCPVKFSPFLLGLSNNLGIQENYIVLPLFITMFTFIMCHCLSKWQVLIPLAKQ
jgi:hypothetical protein